MSEKRKAAEELLGLSDKKNKKLTKEDIGGAFRRKALVHKQHLSNSSDAHSATSDKWQQLQEARDFMLEEIEREKQPVSTTVPAQSVASGPDIQLWLAVFYSELIMGTKRTIEYVCNMQCNDTSKECADCAGRGIRKHKQHLEVKIPKGTKVGATLYYPNMGHGLLVQGKRTMTKVSLKISDKEVFYQSNPLNLDLNLTLNVGYLQALCPYNIKIPLPDQRGAVFVDLTAGVNNPKIQIEPFIGSLPAYSTNTLKETDVLTLLECGTWDGAQRKRGALHVRFKISTTLPVSVPQSIWMAIAVHSQLTTDTVD